MRSIIFVLSVRLPKGAPPKSFMNVYLLNNHLDIYILDTGNLVIALVSPLGYPSVGELESL